MDVSQGNRIEVVNMKRYVVYRGFTRSSFVLARVPLWVSFFIFLSSSTPLVILELNVEGFKELTGKRAKPLTAEDKVLAEQDYKVLQALGQPKPHSPEVLAAFKEGWPRPKQPGQQAQLERLMPLCKQCSGYYIRGQFIIQRDKFDE